MKGTPPWLRSRHISDAPCNNRHVKRTTTQLCCVLHGIGFVHRAYPLLSGVKMSKQQNQPKRYLLVYSANQARVLGELKQDGTRQGPMTYIDRKTRREYVVTEVIPDRRVWGVFGRRPKSRFADAVNLVTVPSARLQCQRILPAHDFRVSRPEMA